MIVCCLMISLLLFWVIIQQFSPRTSGLFPDLMHVNHLALVPDAITSCLLDWSDDSSYVQESSRDKRLACLWESYHSWCESSNIGERATKRLFSSAVLRPDTGAYAEVSQKIINATAARYMVFWLADVAKQFALSKDPLDE